ncbi:PREDICTED: tyrosine-protein kinase PR2-like [Priapulus caudatus]|uniref:non-specific protein-tyrosine kinase n=1 Tax=Priapulus caudatus TaxID=37621 RepID=A0ABM1EA75_PRICU|nr:PREDICTED: tyrosine-protein kinase PR2-like [Priapulus caudatus]
MTTMMAVQSVSLRDFLLEAELQQYHSAFTKDLKVTTVQQLKYVDDEDLMLIGMTKPEMRRLKKFFQKEYPQGTLGRFRKKIMKGSSFDERRASSLPPPLVDKQVANSPSKAANRHIIPSDSITVCKELGVGEFGVVQQGIWTNEDGDRIQVAIKCLSKEHMLNNPMDFLKEACIMHTIDNRHIVRLYGVVLNTRALMLVTELAPLRSLLECLKEPTLRSSFPVSILCEFALQITNGMHYLEDNRLIHRDLAARNVLVFSKNCVKISDFGLSRALGVGKDYYQTNFNVNLKLPIAWCAPECINYLRFTSASDVWALGVTLWEMFSYGFQPWAALTGQQILEAIDEPSYQRLEKPECCPADYYRLMASCWEHEPPKRPTFAELHRVIPNIKPDQVQVIQDSTGTMKKEHLDVKQGDIVTVLDKKPPDAPPNLWKGVLNNGKTGLFKPLHTVPYMGANSKQTKQKPKTLPKPLSLGAVGGGGAAESDGDARRSRPAHRGKLTQDMISPPQGDLRHTLHVGRSEGDVFGDVSFLRGKYAQLPKQRVSPYKPSDDRQAPLRAETPSVGEASDLAPLLCDTASVSSLRYDAKAAPARRNEFNNEGFESASLCADYNQDVAREAEEAAEAEEDGEHSYTEISDESESSSPYNIQPDAFQFENSSFMDEVFKALDESAESLCGDDVTSDPREVNLGHELAGEVDQLARDLERRGGRRRRKKQQSLISIPFPGVVHINFVSKDDDKLR